MFIITIFFFFFTLIVYHYNIVTIDIQIWGLTGPCDNYLDFFFDTKPFFIHLQVDHASKPKFTSFD